jgi:predicted MFS family arabinose efflux permease
MLNPLKSLQKKLRDLPRLTPLVWTLIIGTAIQHFALFMCFPFFAIFLTRNLGATPMRAGLLLMIAPLIVTFGSFFCGHFADRMGRSRAMLSAMFLFALSYGGLAILASAHLEATPAQLFFGLLETLAG